MDIIDSTNKREINMSRGQIDMIMKIKKDTDLEILSLSPCCVAVNDTTDIIKLCKAIRRDNRPHISIVIPCTREEAEIGRYLYEHTDHTEFEKYDTEYASKCMTYKCMTELAYQLNIPVRDLDSDDNDSGTFYRSSVNISWRDDTRRKRNRMRNV